MRLTPGRTLLLTGALVAAPVAAQDPAPAAPPESTTPAPTTTHYKPPVDNRLLADDAEPRALLRALRETGEEVRSDWTQRRTQELGSGMIVRHFDRLYPKDTLARLTGDFREGYVQVFVDVPSMMQITAVEMASPESATEFCRMNMETLQGQLDQTARAEDARVEILHDDEVSLEGLDQAYEKRYEMTMGDLPPSRFHTLFAVAGRYMFTTTFLQMDVAPETAHGVLTGVAARLAGAGAPEGGE